MLGSLHHIDEHNRVKVLGECIRVSKQNAVICIYESNQKGIKMIREKNPFHPDAADPGEYVKGLHLEETRKSSEFFNAFMLKKRKEVK